LCRGDASSATRTPLVISARFAQALGDAQALKEGVARTLGAEQRLEPLLRQRGVLVVAGRCRRHRGGGGGRQGVGLGAGAGIGIGRAGHHLWPKKAVVENRVNTCHTINKSFG